MTHPQTDHEKHLAYVSKARQFAKMKGHFLRNVPRASIVYHCKFCGAEGLIDFSLPHFDGECFKIQCDPKNKYNRLRAYLKNNDMTPCQFVELEKGHACVIFKSTPTSRVIDVYTKLTKAGCELSPISKEPNSLQFRFFITFPKEFLPK